MNIIRHALLIPAVALIALSLTACAGETREGEPIDTASDGLKKGPNIVEVAISANSDGPYAGAFDTLIAAVLAADPAVAETLTGRGQYTVFAPTDDAFEALGLTPDTVGDLDQGFLTDVLLYHVARGERFAEDVVESERIRTLGGEFLEQSDATLTDNLGRESNIIVVDVDASNGVIHAIDAVVLPYAP
ncbi:MAG: fasciclin domain-containing protein [Deltaproteobacteria bacterium]|jgi:uncharacterized surface protein with fasciclin (FAS1) repeats|nr:fasciclin domain-containing protein [Deltaproteobacteria bacterium]MBW2534950.1 fasciclin domain-containing protein [Deltaproteobacteria bacterium]